MANTTQHLLNIEPNYSGLPENYLSVPDGELDTDALCCVVARARAVCAMLSSSLCDNGNAEFNRDITSNACWALEGLLDQAQILLGDKRP